MWSTGRQLDFTVTTLVIGLPRQVVVQRCDRAAVDLPRRGVTRAACESDYGNSCGQGHGDLRARRPGVVFHRRCSSSGNRDRREGRARLADRGARRRSREGDLARRSGRELGVSSEVGPRPTEQGGPGSRRWRGRVAARTWPRERWLRGPRGSAGRLPSGGEPRAACIRLMTGGREIERSRRGARLATLTTGPWYTHVCQA